MGVALAAAAPLGRAQLTATINAQAAITPVARGFAGCSVEMSSMGTWAGAYVPGSPALFDQALVNLLNLLGQYEGAPYIRVGGNSQDRSWLQIDDGAVIPPFRYTTAPSPNAFTPGEVNGLAWVQRLTGAPFTIGLNQGGELPAEAVDEMNAFNGLFDPGGIAAFDVGNEPDESDFASYRPAGWSEAEYTTDLENFLEVLRPASPGSIFAAPAVGGTNWLPSHATSAFNALLAATSGQIAFVTAHRYIANGEDPGTSDPTGLLFEAANSSGIASNYAATQTAAAAYGLPVRINETNTFYNGGLAGVSNAMASALWVADVLGSYAQAGIAGVNFHGGSSGPYTPFTMTATNSGITVAAEPVYYGMMLFAQFIQNGAGMIPISYTLAGSEAGSAYASRDSAGALRVLVINKSETSPLTATLTFANLGGAYQTQGTLIELQAPSLSSTSGLTLAGQSYDQNGNVQGANTAVAFGPETPGSPTYTFQLPVASAAIFVLDVQTPVAPAVTVQASATAANAGAPVSFAASASGSAPFAYQWAVNGSPIAGATGPRLVLPAVQSTDAGNYTVTVSNRAGSVTSAAAPLAIVALPPRLTNVSTLAQLVTNSNPLTAGFVIGGQQSRTVLIRAAGPALQAFGVASPLAHPTLTLVGADGDVLGVNTGWSTASNASAISAAEAQYAGFSFQPGSADSAMLVTLAPGAYSAQITDAAGESGVALAEVYQSDSGFGTGRLVNLSTRAAVGGGSNSLTAGFWVNGTASKQVLVRGIGPDLAAYSVPSPLATPLLQVFSGGTLLGSNQGWDANGQGPAVAAAEAATGAFTLPAGSADTALVLTLPPGGYTAQVSGVNGSTGTALVEVYEITSD